MLRIVYKYGHKLPFHCSFQLIGLLPACSFDQRIAENTILYEGLFIDYVWAWGEAKYDKR